jgi:hypothetical protein
MSFSLIFWFVGTLTDVDAIFAVKPKSRAKTVFVVAEQQQRA